MTKRKGPGTGRDPRAQAGKGSADQREPEGFTEKPTGLLGVSAGGQRMVAVMDAASGRYVGEIEGKIADRLASEHSLGPVRRTCWIAFDPIRNEEGLFLGWRETEYPTPPAGRALRVQEIEGEGHDWQRTFTRDRAHYLGDRPEPVRPPGRGWVFDGDATDAEHGPSSAWRRPLSRPDERG